MSQQHYLSKLTSLFKTLPGVGHKTAQRYALHILNEPENKIEAFCETVLEIKKKLIPCPQCGCISLKNKCIYCERSSTLCCIVGTMQDVFLIDDLQFKGHFHVLGTQLSPHEPDNIFQHSFLRLKQRLCDLKIKEVIIALDMTLEGDVTALFLKKNLAELEIKMTRLASGIPLGNSLNYTDKGTLTYALNGRQSF